jgi:hypothetical protein
MFWRLSLEMSDAWVCKNKLELTTLWVVLPLLRSSGLKGRAVTGRDVWGDFWALSDGTVVAVLDGGNFTGFVKLIWSISEGKDVTFVSDPIVVCPVGVAAAANDDGGDGGSIVKFVVQIMCDGVDSDWSGPEWFWIVLKLLVVVDAFKLEPKNGGFAGTGTGWSLLASGFKLVDWFWVSKPARIAVWAWVVVNTSALNVRKRFLHWSRDWIR